MQKKNLFLAKRKEDSNLNQYWFSQSTIEFLCSQVERNCQGFSAFLSTPSVYFSLKKEISNAYLFEYDKRFEKEANFVFYDFNKPLEVNVELQGKFDFILIDPPFITKEVWEKYAETIKFLVKKSEDGQITGKILLSSIKENEQMLEELLGVKPKVYKPSIPNLVYQYNFYCNYEDEQLNNVNEEIGF